jgi:hypothetical protein
VKKYLFAASIIITVYLSLFYHSELLLAVWILSGIVFVAMGIGLVFLGWYASERIRMIRADRIEREKSAHVLTIHQHGQFWVRDTDHRAVWHGLHLEQRVYSNGRNSYDEPTEQEQLAWRTFNQKPTKVIEQPQQMAALPEPHIDLLTALDNAQRTLIVGASNSGKTTLLQHIISRRRGQVVVIDPHSFPNKWPVEKVIGIGRDYEAIAETLTGLVRLMSQRYDEIGKGEVAEGQHPPITIVIDEWRAIVQHVDSAGEAIKTLLTESRKAAMSVFVATHSDRAKPLGLEGEYDLKDGFSIVHLFWEGGRHLATIDTGQGHQPAIVPGPFVINQPTDRQDELSLPEPTLEPDEQEQQILDLYRQGLPKTRIAMEVFGNKGGHQSRKIEEVVQKFENV